MRTSLLALPLLAGTALAAASPQGFSFSPVPRWAEEADTEEVCAAIARECPAMAALGSIEAEFGYDALYDVAGKLVGMRMTKSTGCKPLDEHLLLGQRRFTQAFSKEGESDLDGIRAELAAGVDPAAVRIVKPDGTSVSMGCG